MFPLSYSPGSFIRPRLVSLGLSLNKTLVGFAGGGLVVSAVVVRVCGRWPLAGGALWSGGARAPRLVAGPRPVLSDCSWGSETPPDAEKPVHTRERMVHGSRVGQRLGFFVSAVHRTRRRIATTVDGFPIPPSTGYFRAPPPDQPDLRPRAPAPASEGPPRPSDAGAGARGRRSG